MISIKAEAKSDLRASMRAVERELRDVSTLSGPVYRQLVEQTGRHDALQNRDTFAKQATPGGSRWQPLSAAYAARKRKERPGRKMLVWDGQLRSSATRAADPHRLAFLRGGVINLGTNHPLARKHQEGFRGLVSVRPHHRKLGVAGDGFRILPKSGKSRAQVRGYTYRANLPARPFIGKSAQQAGELKATITMVLTERMERASAGRLKHLRLGAARSGGRLVTVVR